MNCHTKPRDIYVIGAQCTGKTTLVTALQDHFNNGDIDNERRGHHTCGPKIVMELARTILQQYGFTADDIISSPVRALALQQRILKSQLDAERAISKHGEWFISDRSGADPIVYARKYVSEEAEDDMINSAEWLELRERMRNSVIIVCEAGADWLTDDGVRLMPTSREDWVELHQLFCTCLTRWGLSYQVLPYDLRSLSARVAFVLGKWEQSKTD